MIDLDEAPIAPADAPPLRPLRDGQPHTGEIFGFERADGSRAWIAGNAIPLRRTPGEPPWAVLFSFTDVTERIEGERRFRQVFDGALAGIALVSPDGMFRDVNPALGRILGSTPESLRGRDFSELVLPEDRPLDAAAMARLVGGEEPGHQIDLRLATADRRGIWVAVRRSLVRDGAGRPAYVVMHLVEVTERYALVGTLRDRLATLEELNVALADFAGRASHDLKSPLMAIGGFASTLRDRWHELDDPTREEMLDRVAGATSRAASMVAGLLADAHRAAEGGRGSATQPLPALRAALASAGLADGDVTVAGRWSPVAVPANDLESIFTNVVDNAHHYGRSGSGVLDLRISAQVQDAVLVVTCADSGPGLPEPEQVFQPFFRGPGSERINPHSTGLGLALVRRAIERWGGSATGGRSETGGALIRLYLPLA
jgi:PAS domain S-box-containing protein